MEGRRLVERGGCIASTGSAMITACRKVGQGFAAGLLIVACDLAGDIERPRPRFAVSPVEYPVEMWDQNVEATTVVRVLVSEAGDVDSAMIAESSGYAELDSAALRGARIMEFEPALRGGEPLEVWARIPVHFAKDPGLPAGALPERDQADSASDSGTQASDGEGSQGLP